MIQTVLLVMIFNILLIVGIWISLIATESPEWPKAQRENVSHDVLHIAWVAEQR